MVTLESFISAMFILTIAVNLVALLALQLSTETGSETYKILGWVLLAYAAELIAIIIFLFS